MAWLRWVPATAGLVCLLSCLRWGRSLPRGRWRRCRSTASSSPPRAWRATSSGPRSRSAARSWSSPHPAPPSTAGPSPGPPMCSSAIPRPGSGSSASGSWLRMALRSTSWATRSPSTATPSSSPPRSPASTAPSSRVRPICSSGTQGGADNWGLVTKLTEATASPVANFGSSLALKGDLLAVGSSRGGTNGRVTIFERDRGGPGSLGQGHYDRRHRGGRRRQSARVLRRGGGA